MDFSGLDNLSGAYAESRILHAAVELNLFDVIGERRMSSQEISEGLGTNWRATELLLNALTALKLIEKKECLFSLTEVSKKHLLSSSKTCYTGMIRFESALWNAWKDLAAAVRTGRPVRVTDMYQADPDETECFIMAMHHLVSARGDAERLAEMLNVEGVRSILDIGSGPGTYPVAVCRRHPQISAAIFDLPGTLEVTKKILEKEGFTGSIRLIAGDYNSDPLPSGFDLIFLSNIIHGEDEDRNRSLIKKVHNSLNKGGRIIIKDHIMNEDLTEPACGAIFSITMLLTTSGRDYGYHEIRMWLEEAGFTEITLEALRQPMSSSLVTGRKN